MADKPQNIYHSTTSLAPLQTLKPQSGSNSSKIQHQSQQSSRIKKIITKSKSFVNQGQLAAAPTNNHASNQSIKQNPMI